ncbi:MAG: ATP-binding protein [Candidatus Aquicultorales bacterium]
MKNDHKGTYIRHIDPEVCNGCAACIVVCGTGAIQYMDDHAYIAYPERCDGDGLCLKACPTSAIYLAPE